MSTRIVDPFAVSMEISTLGMRLGILEGQARERGYPLLPDAKLIDCGQLVLSLFEKHRGSLRKMQTELDGIYTKLQIVSTDLTNISVPEMRAIFEGQIKLLHEKRGVLTHSINAFDSLLSAHILIEELEKRVVVLQEQVDLFNTGKIGIEEWESINNSIEDFLLRLRIVFPDSNRGAGNFCHTHNQSKELMLGTVGRCRFDLNSKKTELLEKSRLECMTNLDALLSALDKMRRVGQASGGEIENVQKLFGLLPLDLRTLLFAARSILPEDQIQNTIISETPLDRGPSPQIWAEVRGLSYFDAERDLDRYNRSVDELLGRCGEQKKADISERDQARASLNKFVATLPRNEISNPQLLLEAFGRISSQHPKFIGPVVAKNLEVYLAHKPEEVKETLRDPVQSKNVAENRLPNVPVLTSLKGIKEQIEAYRAAKRYDGAQKERLVTALLDAAESKGGVSLAVDKGVYYWIWFLAHEKDPSAGGPNFGKNNAPKDLDRLIMAIDKSMPVIERPLSAPAITISTPLSSPQRIPVIREKGPVPLTPISSPVRAPLKPSEVKNGTPSRFLPPVTEIKVKCKVPEGHFLTICGQGGDLDWTVGKSLIKVDEETYVYKIEGATGKIEYKIVLDGMVYERGTNRVIEAQKSQEIVPSLAMPKAVVVVNFAPKDNKLFICGTGPGMSWDQNRKIELKQINGKFVLESMTEMGNFEFKILQSNNLWSKDPNYKAESGKAVQITPKF